MPPLSVHIKDGFYLTAGEITSNYHTELQRDIYTITPPSVSMFDQLIAYLHNQSNPVHTTGIQVRYLGVGLAAICIRWGTYLAALLNPQAPSHPTLPTKKNELQLEEISYITDSEMMRLNLEVSSNLTRLGGMYRENSSAFYDLLEKAYVYLPMPTKSTRPNHELEENLIYAYIDSSLKGYLSKHPEEVQELMSVAGILESPDPANIKWESVDVQQADRIIGNFLANFAWRNTIIEDYHAGRNQPNALLLPNQRRFTERDERRLFGELCSNSAVLVRQIERLFEQKTLTNHPLDKYIARYPSSAEALYNSRWNLFYTYPRNWSVIDSTSTIKL